MLVKRLFPKPNSSEIHPKHIIYMLVIKALVFELAPATLSTSGLTKQSSSSILPHLTSLKSSAAWNFVSHLAQSGIIRAKVIVPGHTPIGSLANDLSSLVNDPILGYMHNERVNCHINQTQRRLFGCMLAAYAQRP